MSDSQNILNVVFIGHVDAGKSTLCGQILNQLQLIDPRTLEKFRQESIAANRESWYLSYALDTTPEERAKGKTTEVGRTSFDLPNKKIIVLDAPGHKMYVSDMISGASIADLAILVVSARTGEFEAGLKGQTHEHVLLARACGIKKLLVVVNKMDEVEWSEKRFLEIKNGLDLIKKIYNNIDFIPISGYCGDNVGDSLYNDVESKMESLSLNSKDKYKAWYNGPSLLKYLDDFVFERDVEPFTFTITEKSKQTGAPLFLGKVSTGNVKKGDEIIILPGNKKSNVQFIYDDDDVEIESACTGDFIKMRIKDFDDNALVLINNSSDFLKICDEFTCQLSVLNVKNILSPGYSCVLHLRGIQRNVKIVEFRTKINDKMVKKTFAKKGDKVLAKIKVESAIVVGVYEDSKKNDYFCLRDEGLTVGIGIVRKVVEFNK